MIYLRNGSRRSRLVLEMISLDLQVPKISKDAPAANLPPKKPFKRVDKRLREDERS